MRYIASHGSRSIKKCDRFAQVLLNNPLHVQRCKNEHRNVDAFVNAVLIMNKWADLLGSMMKVGMNGVCTQETS